MSKVLFLVFINVDYCDLRLLGCYDTYETARDGCKRLRGTDIIRYVFDEKGDCANLIEDYMPGENDIFYPS